MGRVPSNRKLCVCVCCCLRTICAFIFSWYGYPPISEGALSQFIYWVSTSFKAAAWCGVAELATNNWIPYYHRFTHSQILVHQSWICDSKQKFDGMIITVICADPVFARSRNHSVHVYLHQFVMFTITVLIAYSCWRVLLLMARAAGRNSYESFMWYNVYMFHKISLKKLHKAWIISHTHEHILAKDKVEICRMYTNDSRFNCICNESYIM